MKNERKHIAVIGLGFVGLPLSLSYAMKGFKTYGIDTSDGLINELCCKNTQHLESYKGKPIKQILNECIGAELFIPCLEAKDAFMNCDKYIITVGIPACGSQLDLSCLKAACRTLSKGLKREDVVIIRSTVVPGTTENVLIPILEESGLKAGKDFYFCYCPERISEGNAFNEFESLQVVISGVNAQSIKKGTKVIKKISSFEPYVVSSIKLAEICKVVENVQRDVSIALVQQLSGFCRRLGIDVFELVAATNTHPRTNLLKPGPGVGGYCIPNAFHYLKPKADETGADLSLMELSRSINDAVPDRIAREIEEKLSQKKQDNSNIKIAVLGIAMKDYCSDCRQSPPVQIIQSLIKRGFEVCAYDPCVRKCFDFQKDSLEQCLKNADALLISALQNGINHNDFKSFSSLMKENAIVFDTRNIVDRSKASSYGFNLVELI